MLQKVFIAVTFSLMMFTSTATAQISDKPVIAVETFKVANDTAGSCDKECSEAILVKLFESGKFILFDLNEKEIHSADKKTDLDYLVRGSVDVQTSDPSFVKVLIDFELVDAKTEELIWGRRIWHKEPSNKKKYLPLTIHNTIFLTADKVVERLIADIDSGKLVLKRGD